ncbi:MAG: alpha-2-macroglobulin family protein, partial [Sphingobacteriales bacterium]
QFDIEIPQFSGEIRLMAVAYKGNQFGSQGTTMTVADPIVLSSSLPRFLSPGDTVNMPVTVTNTTAKGGTASATLKVSGPLQVVGNATQQLSMAANSESRALFRVAASEAIGIGNIQLEVKGHGETFSESNEISIRPSAPLQVLTGSGTVTGAGKTAINIPLSDFLPNTSSYKLVISRNPALQLGRQLRYLVQYPYGCTEQIVSSAFAQLYFGDIAEQLYGRSSTAAGMRANANYNVTEAIRKVKLRQLYNGGLALWEGEGSEHWWTSVYATHFLIEASRAGFDVDKKLLDGLLIYINAKLKNKQTVNYYYNQKQQKKIAPKEIAYGLYVLALADRANISVMNYYKANLSLLSLDSRYLLSAAYAIGGDKTKFRELLPGSFSGEVADTETGGSFSSPIRDEAIALNALLEVDPANTQIGVMAKHVSDQLKQRSWFNTQESSFSLLALGKLARAASKSTVTGEVQVNGKAVANIGAQVVQLDNRQLNGNNISLVTKGEGQLFYFWESEGISASGSFKEEDNFLKVRKRFFDRSGNLMNGQSFRQNDLIIVELALEKSYSGSVENIVITDMLPAGFEIENPRTREIPGMDWIKNAGVPVSLDVRDDRINLFVDLHNNRQVYYYAVRAVTP